MEIRQISSLARPGTPGLDVFKIAGRSISGFLPSFKTGDSRQVRIPFTTHLEEQLAMFLEYHPHVRTYQRGDASPAFVTAYHLFTPLPTPYRISYLYEGKPHDYLPDFVGTLCDDGLLIAEAGREEEKSRGRALLKAEAARRLAQLKGGVYWLGTDAHLSSRRHQNWLYLHARRRPFSTSQEIAETLLAHWPYGDIHTVQELVQRFGRNFSEVEVEAAVWKLVGDAAAQGRLLVNLSEMELSQETELSFLDPHAPPIRPDPLPSSLEATEPEPALLLGDEKEEDEVLDLHDGIPGPTFDASVLASAEQQALFHRNLAAVQAVLAGRGTRGVAEAYGMAPSPLSRLARRAKELGQIACVPYATYRRERVLRVEFQHLIRKLYIHPLRPSAMAVYEDEQLAKLVRGKLSPLLPIVRSMTSSRRSPESFLSSKPALASNTLRVNACHHSPLCSPLRSLPWFVKSMSIRWIC